MSRAEAAEMGTVERIIVRADEPPWALVTRIAIGYALVPAWTTLAGRDSSPWTLIPFFVGVLASLRMVPVVCRKLLPFGAAARATWTARRQIAKQYDSYQWQKLLSVGLGLAVYAFQDTTRSHVQIGLTLFCLLSGAAALVIWRQNDAGRPRHVATVRGI